MCNVIDYYENLISHPGSCTKPAESFSSQANDCYSTAKDCSKKLLLIFKLKRKKIQKLNRGDRLNTPLSFTIQIKALKFFFVVKSYFPRFTKYFRWNVRSDE